jgi:hypothetical protein
MSSRLGPFGIIAAFSLALPACNKSSNAPAPPIVEHKAPEAKNIIVEEDAPGPQAVAIPKNHKGVSFSKDGKRVAFIVEEGKRYRAIVDGREEELHDGITIV